MEKNVLYIQSKAVPANALKERFEGSDIILHVVDSVGEALMIMEEHDIKVVLCCIKDVKQLDFIRQSVKNHPEVMLNICLDITEANIISNIANIREVKKLHVYPWELTDIEEGIMSTIDQQLIESDLIRRQNTLRDDKASLQHDIETLTAVLQKQRDSYNRLSMVLKPYMEEAVKIAASKMPKDPKGDIPAEDNLYYNLVKRTCDRMLRVMTTGKLEADKLKLYMTEDVTRGLPQSGRIKLKSIENCLVGNRDRDKIGLIVFAVWRISVYQSYRLATGEIVIDSFYLGEALVRYEVSAKGKENPACPEIIHEYVAKAAESVCQSYIVERSGDTVKYSMDFEV